MLPAGGADLEPPAVEPTVPAVQGTGHGEVVPWDVAVESGVVVADRDVFLSFPGPLGPREALEMAAKRLNGRVLTCFNMF